APRCRANGTAPWSAATPRPTRTRPSRPSAASCRSPGRSERGGAGPRSVAGEEVADAVGQRGFRAVGDGDELLALDAPHQALPRCRLAAARAAPVVHGGGHEVVAGAPALDHGGVLEVLADPPA